MEPIRVTFWNVPHWAELGQYGLGFLAVLIFAYGTWRHVRIWRRGKPETLSGSWTDRVKNFLLFAIGQKKVLRDPYPGVMHLAIFWGMAFLLLGTILATVDWDVTHLFFDYQFLKGPVYLIYELVLDLFTVVLLIGVGMAIYRRYVTKPDRLAATVTPTFPLDSLYLLGILGLIALTGLAAEGFRIAAQNPPGAAWSPVGYGLSKIFQVFPHDAQLSLHFGFWSLHGLLAFGFIASIPFSKAFHLFSSPINILLRDAGPKGSVTPVNELGASAVTDFSWRQLLQIDSCTWCGRCQDVCPAHACGFPLSPRDVLMKLNQQLVGMTKSTNGAKGNNGDSLHGTIFSRDELWSCTTCMACEETCPVLLEQPRLLVELRRHLLNTGGMDTEVQDVLMNLQRYGNSFGQSAKARAKWTKDLGFPVKDARKEPVEYLWFVGDYASFDPRVQEITKKTAQVLHALGIDFGILYDKEKNAGNDARRIGEEGLFEMLRDGNLKELESAQFHTLLTTDPHTYHVLKNEYGFPRKTNGESFSPAVLHYTELFERLMVEGRIPVRQALNLAVTYHDPCYLGRYNGIYESPRRVLNGLGARVVEMPLNRADSFCCGAGGGRIWMKDLPGVTERPAVRRIREALHLPDVSVFVTACPKDYAMFGDALKTVGAEERLRVADVSELLYEAMAIQAEETMPS